MRIQFLRFKQQGVVLVEALLAIVILSIALTSIIQAMMSSLQASAASVDYIRGVGILNRVMVKRLISTPESFASVPCLRFPEPFEFYSYKVQVSDNIDPVYADLNFRGFDISVSWPAGEFAKQSERVLSVEFLVPGKAEKK